MTAPARTGQPDQGEPLTEAEAAVVALIAAWLASPAAIRATLLPARLVASLGTLRIATRAARAAGKMALGVPMTGRSRFGAPTVPNKADWIGPGSDVAPSMARRVAAEEPKLRATYILNAAKRLTRALVEGEFIGAITAEKRNLGAHVAAGRNRATAAKALDDVAAREGPWLQWHTIMDGRTTADCAVLNGRIFTIANPPGVPGGEHPSCRCTAVGVNFASPRPAAA